MKTKTTKKTPTPTIPPKKKTTPAANTEASKPSNYHKYNRQETMELICNLVARKQTLNQICQLPDMPSHETVRLWMNAEPELLAMYTCAREMRADARADRIDEITVMVLNGELDPAAARVVIDAEKWLAGKEMPKRYGDKIEQTINGEITYNKIEVQVIEPPRR